jgi:hypothetical protein
MAVLEGRMDPIPGIHYDAFLNEYIENQSTGLTIPTNNQ